MKGYRTPSWFRMKGFRNKKQIMPPKQRGGPIKPKATTGKPK